jgi:hypothetical protein
VEALDPIPGEEGNLEQQRPHDIIGGAKHAIGLAILGRGVET